MVSMILSFARAAKYFRWANQEPRDQALDNTAQRGAARRIILFWPSFVHVAALRHFQLQCMYAFRWLSVVAGNVATLEPPVVCGAELLGRGKVGEGLFGQQCVATGTVG